MRNKLLIFVNKFDKNDDLLGFFVGWANELAKCLPEVIIVTQYAGDYDRLANLKVVSIEKEQNANPTRRVFKFWKLLWNHRHDYDGVLVVMAPAWAIVASLATKVLGKKLYLWYAVWRGNWRLHLAEKLTDKIFCSVPESFPFKSKKLMPIGQGIDTDYFLPEPSVRQPGKILFLGRISPIKKVEHLLRLIFQIKSYDMTVYHNIQFDIVGGPVNKKDDDYVLQLRKLAESFGIAEKINWLGRVPHSDTRRYYQEADIFINLTPTGSFDKTMLEAMACGDLVLASNQALAKFFMPKHWELFIFEQDNPSDLAVKLSQVLNLSLGEKEKYRQELRQIIIEHHSQKQWARKLVASF